MLFTMSLYYLSFTPLWFTVVLMDYFSIHDNPNNTLTEMISILGILLCFFLSLVFTVRGLSLKNKDNSKELLIIDANEDKFMVAEFLMSYTFPLLAFDFSNYRGVIYFSVFFVCFGWLCCRHNFFCNNIVLEAMNYRVFDCKLKNSDGVVIKTKVLSRRKIKQAINTRIVVRSLNNDIDLDCGEPRKIHIDN